MYIKLMNEPKPRTKTISWHEGTERRARPDQTGLKMHIAAHLFSSHTNSRVIVSQSWVDELDRNKGHRLISYKDKKNDNTLN